MPGRRVLTDEQLKSLLARPEEADLVRHYTFSRADLDAIDRRRRDHNRLGDALQLCAFRCPGQLLRSGEAIPEETLRFVAEQIGVEAPDTIAAYAARTQTRRQQLDDLREPFGFAAFTPEYGRLFLGWLLPVVLATTSGFAVAQALPILCADPHSAVLAVEVALTVAPRGRRLTRAVPRVFARGQVSQHAPRGCRLPDGLV